MYYDPNDPYGFDGPFTGPIDQPAPYIQRHHARWRKNRAFVEGEQAVKSFGEQFLPRIRVDDSDAQYAVHQDNTPFYPAVTKIAQGMEGLLNRKRPQLNASDRVQRLARTITPANGSLDGLAEDAVHEQLVTDYTGLLTDVPDTSVFEGLSDANAFERGARPRIAMYQAESILEAREQWVEALQRVTFTRVRLLERQGNRVLELLLINGQYEQRIHDRDGSGAWVTRTVVPTMDELPLTEIPFVLITSGKADRIKPSLLSSSVDVNLQHYRLSGILANMTWLTAGPITTIIGFNRATETVKDGQGNETVREIDPNWDFSPNAIIEIKGDKNKIALDYFIFDPKGAELVEKQLAAKKDELSIIGLSMISPTKEAPQAPETLMIQQSGENAILAGFSRMVGRGIEKALTFAARWDDPNVGEIKFSLNQDFLPTRLSAQDVTAYQTLYMNDIITLETLLHALQDGEWVGPSFDVEAEAELVRVQAESRGAPALPLSPPAGDDTSEAE